MDRVEALHNIGFVHRDITPKNIVWLNFSDFASIDKDNLVLIDYGVAGPYIINDNKHINFIEKYGIIGTQYFSLVYSRKGNTLSRRDDLKAIFNCVYFFFNGILPWDSTLLNQTETKSKYINSLITKNAHNNDFKKQVKKILKIKENTTPTEFCNEMSSEFKIIFCYIKNLSFEENPDYESIKLLLTKLIQKEEIKNLQEKKFKYCWEKVIRDLFDYKTFLKTKLKLLKNSLFPGHPIDVKKLLHLLNINI